MVCGAIAHYKLKRIMQTKPLIFGSVKIDFPVVLAPMAGYTDSPMRSLCLEHGAGAVYSELTSAEGLRRDSKRTLQVLETAPNEHPIAGHIFGRDPQAMVDAAQMVEQLGVFDWIDLNCGCPVKKVVSRGAGAALMKELPLLGQIIEQVKAAVTLPVSVKTRIGFNQTTPDHLEIAKVVEGSGADMVAVHGRLTKNFHGGEADWEKLGEMKQAIGIPLIGNGGIQTHSEALEKMETYGVDGVMIGRAAIGNPWIFQSDARVELVQRRELIAEHLRRLVALHEWKQKEDHRCPHKYSPEEAACIQFRTHIPYYVRGLFDKKRLLSKLVELTTSEAILSEVDILMAKCANYCWCKASRKGLKQ
jgi:tRNA-dihydrouridine synthase B